MNRTIFVICVCLLFTGCASVKMESQGASDKAKQFAQPSDGNAGLYIFRDLPLGVALKKSIWVDEKCIGQSANQVFFYTEVIGNKQHVISTQSEFSPNTLALMVEAGKNYFIRQYIKFGVFIGGADLEVVPEEAGKAAVLKTQLASPGVCSD